MKYLYKNNLKIRNIIIAILAIFTPFLSTGSVFADPYDDQISATESKITETQNQIAALKAQGDTLEIKLSSIRAEINLIQLQISENESKNNQLTSDIKEATDKLEAQKILLTDQVRKIYESSDTSLLTMIASSKSISDFVDKREERAQVRNRLNTLVAEVKALKADLEKQQYELQLIIQDQKIMNDQLTAKNDEVANLLVQTRGQESEYQNILASQTNDKVRLQKAQAEANEAALRALNSSNNSGGISGSSGLIYTSSNGQINGGYPSYYYNLPQDAISDKWGMYNRECVSYTAFKVWQSGRYMPYWGGIGNANMWPGNARRAGIPMDGNPRVGDVAISMEGYYGHAMYVERVNSNGTILVSQYNYGIAGEYSEMTINSYGLYFIHFP